MHLLNKNQPSQSLFSKRKSVRLCNLTFRVQEVEMYFINFFISSPPFVSKHETEHRNRSFLLVIYGVWLNRRYSSIKNESFELNSGPL